MFYPTDTIAAISTPYGAGGIAVIRISGEQAVTVADRVFRGKAALCHAPTHTVHYGGIYDSGEKLDQVLVTVFLAPKSYTRENVVEIGCHGGVCCASRVLSAVLSAGARLAEPGEFTKRAYLNGRLDLAEAEAVMTLITARTPTGCRAAINQLEGHLSKKMDILRGELIALSAHVQVLCDYPEEGLEPLSDAEFAQKLDSCKKTLAHLLQGADRGRLVREGVDTVIAGQPNVGKSSLLNLLCGSDRAIVTDLPGTTRDSLEESVTLGNVLLRLTDTAGIRETDQSIEAMGVERAKQLVSHAALVLYLVDGSAPVQAQDVALLGELDPARTVILRNKADAGIALPAGAFPEFPHQLDFSARTGQGLTELEGLITRLVTEGGDAINENDTLLLGVRARAALEGACRAVTEAAQGLALGFTPDTVLTDIESAITHLGQVDGKTAGQEVVDAMFHQFCLGK